MSGLNHNPDTFRFQHILYGIPDLLRKPFLHLKSSSKHLSLVLGTSVVSPLELAGAFSTFANNGIWSEPVSISYKRLKTEC